MQSVWSNAELWGPLSDTAVDVRDWDLFSDFGTAHDEGLIQQTQLGKLSTVSLVFGSSAAVLSLTVGSVRSLLPFEQAPIYGR